MYQGYREMAQVSVRLNMSKIKVFVFSDGDLAIFHAVSTLNPTSYSFSYEAGSCY